mmetsp:Transcript_12897/g.31376  ORF Transcript_12897/g.31376 Transcript_12897/m.31376 type:complete len:416 (-) Transcript_12897:449-1696(-)
MVPLSSSGMVALLAEASRAPLADSTDMAAMFPDPSVEDTIVGFPLRLITELSPAKGLAVVASETSVSPAESSAIEKASSSKSCQNSSPLSRSAFVAIFSVLTCRGISWILFPVIASTLSLVRWPNSSGMSSRRLSWIQSSSSVVMCPMSDGSTRSWLCVSQSSRRLVRARASVAGNRSILFCEIVSTSRETSFSMACGSSEIRFPNSTSWRSMVRRPISGGICSILFDPSASDTSFRSSPTSPGSFPILLSFRSRISSFVSLNTDGWMRVMMLDESERRVRFESSTIPGSMPSTALLSNDMSVTVSIRLKIRGTHPSLLLFMLTNSTNSSCRISEGTLVMALLERLSHVTDRNSRILSSKSSRSKLSRSMMLVRGQSIICRKYLSTSCAPFICTSRGGYFISSFPSNVKFTSREH